MSNRNDLKKLFTRKSRQSEQNIMPSKNNNTSGDINNALKLNPDDGGGSIPSERSCSCTGQQVASSVVVKKIEIKHWVGDGWNPEAEGIANISIGTNTINVDDMSDHHNFGRSDATQEGWSDWIVHFSGNQNIPMTNYDTDLGVPFAIYVRHSNPRYDFEFRITFESVSSNNQTVEWVGLITSRINYPDMYYTNYVATGHFQGGFLGNCGDACNNVGALCIDETWCFGNDSANIVYEHDVWQRQYVGVPEFEVGDTGLERTGNYLLYWSGKSEGDQIWPFYNNGVCKNDVMCYYLEQKWQQGYITSAELNFYKYEDQYSKYGKWTSTEYLANLHNTTDGLPWAPPYGSMISRDHERAVLPIEFGAYDKLLPTNGQDFTNSTWSPLFYMLYDNFSPENIMDDYDLGGSDVDLSYFTGIKYTDIAGWMLSTYYADVSSYERWSNLDDVQIFNNRMDPSPNPPIWWMNMSTNVIHSTQSGDTSDYYEGDYYHLSLFAHQGTTFSNCGPDSYSCLTYGNYPGWESLCSDCPSWYTEANVPGWEPGYPLNHPAGMARLNQLHLTIHGGNGYNTIPSDKAIVNFKFGQPIYSNLWESVTSPPGREPTRKKLIKLPNNPFERGGNISGNTMTRSIETGVGMTGKQPSSSEISDSLINPNDKINKPR